MSFYLGSNQKRLSDFNVLIIYCYIFSSSNMMRAYTAKSIYSIIQLYKELSGAYVKAIFGRQKKDEDYSSSCEFFFSFLSSFWSYFCSLPVETSSSISSLVMVSCSIKVSLMRVTSFLFSLRILVASL